MSVKTTADEHVDRARDHIAKARKEIGEVFLNRKEMWGADSFRPGYIKNLFNRLEALQRAIDGEDHGGEALADMIPLP